MKEFLILIAAKNKRGLSEADEQHCIHAYGKWAEELAEKHISARRLSMETGEWLPQKKGVVTDGPFAEAKELIAGFILISAETKEDAKHIALSCPLNDYFDLYVKETD